MPRPGLRFGAASVMGSTKGAEMDILLWRHAEAEDTTPDLDRALTKRGRQQAQAMAGWLDRHLAADARILVSPALRAQQTAKALGRGFETVPEIAPQAGAEALLEAAGWPQGEGMVLLVGHQPTLGQAVSLLLCGKARDFSVKKGAVVWLAARERGGRSEVVLRAVLAPELL